VISRSTLASPSVNELGSIMKLTTETGYLLSEKEILSHVLGT
jgi:hypothetical protein